MTEKNKKTVLITGASSGIGRATALLLAQKGWHLILVARRIEKLNELQAEILKNHNDIRVQVFALDVARRGEVEKWFLENYSVLNDLDILINNAGLARGVDAVMDARFDDWEAMVQTNIMGLLYLTRLFLPLLIKKGKGASVVNLGSVAGRYVYPGGAVYAATKFAVRALSEGMRMDLAGTHVRVMNIEPGMTETEFSMVRLGDAEKARAVYEGMEPLRAEDIAECILWCLSLPGRVNVQELVVFPTDQAAVGMVSRSKAQVK